MTQHAPKSGNKGYGEPGFSDVAGFLKSNALFIGILTLLTSAVVVGVALLLPQQYSKQITLDPATVPTSILTELNQPAVFDDAQLGSLAVDSVQNADLDGVSASPTYDTATRQVNVALQAESEAALEDAVPALLSTLEDGFAEAYERPLDNILDARVDGLQETVETNRAAAESLEQETGDLTGSDPRTLARLEGLEVARAGALAEIARSEAGIREFEETREDLPRLADEAVEVQVVSESEAPQSRSLGPIVALALMLGLVVAVAAAIVRTVLKKAK